MTVGEKLKRLRMEQGMTQKELGQAVGFPKSNADVRMTQYERGYRLPKKELLNQFAQVLEENPSVFVGRNAVERTVQEIYWMTPQERQEVVQAVEELKDKETDVDLGNITEDELILWKIKWTSHQAESEE
ncbi:MAG: helix-turn-helix transcriptional regulator [Eubacteriales bacterium]